MIGLIVLLVVVGVCLYLVPPETGGSMIYVTCLHVLPDRTSYSVFRSMPNSFIIARHVTPSASSWRMRRTSCSVSLAL